MVRNIDSIGLRVLREVSNIFANKKARRVQVRCSSRVVDFLRKNKKERIEAVEEEFGRGIVISVDPNAGPEDYEIKRFDK